MKNNSIEEIYWLRALACLAIVFLHSIQESFLYYKGTNSGIIETVLLILLIAMMFATPTFVFISEFLLAKKYSTGVPNGFFKKRLLFLGIPYLFMGFIYALLDKENHSAAQVIKSTFENIFLGTFTVYFILIIFQFYILHTFFSKYLDKWSPKVVIPIALIINAIYLAFFTLTEPANIPYADYIWKRGYWLPFIGWLFYFVMGYYCGRNYDSFIKIVKKYKVLITLGFVGSLGIVVVFTKMGIILSSKRPDILLYSTLVTFLIVAIQRSFRKTPQIIYVISKYSFSIFLIHHLIIHALPHFNFLNMVSYTVFCFLISLGCSMIIAHFVNKFKYGKFLVGNLGKVPQNNQLKKQAS
ncbi:acyltransferase family protein [Priestia aryabhattai]|uniref:Acyltransferase family protein n=1 Tax=Priestia aryabhattai TaxID=412384 RepID=A0AAX6NH81_PRIAR|nr:acyltransferase family protein [Priestia aryabhattai]MDU9695137.1 acyltransferase family protein [Priestia aryabhattai]